MTSPLSVDTLPGYGASVETHLPFSQMSSVDPPSPRSLIPLGPVFFPLTLDEIVSQIRLKSREEEEEEEDITKKQSQKDHPLIETVLDDVSSYSSSSPPPPSSSSSTPPSSSWTLSLVYGEMKPHAIASLLKLAHSYIEYHDTAVSIIGNNTKLSTLQMNNLNTSEVVEDTQKLSTLTQSKSTIIKDTQKLSTLTSNNSNLLSFADLGSGEGWPVLICAILFSLKQSIGIELVSKHIKRAKSHLQLLKNTTSHYGKDFLSLLSTQSTPTTTPIPEFDYKSHSLLKSRLDSVEFIQDSFLNISWSHCKLVFCNATAFEGTLLTSIFVQSENMKPGSIFILTTQKHTSKLFECVHEGKYSPSWDEKETIIARIYRRKKLPKWISNVLGRPRN